MNVAWVVLHCNRRIGAREHRQLIPHVRFQVPFLGPESQLKSGFACAGLLSSLYLVNTNGGKAMAANACWYGGFPQVPSKSKHTRFLAVSGTTWIGDTRLYYPFTFFPFCASVALARSSHIVVLMNQLFYYAFTLWKTISTYMY